VVGSWFFFRILRKLQKNLNTTLGLSIDKEGANKAFEDFYSNLSKKIRSSGIFFFFRISTHESTMAGDPQM